MGLIGVVGLALLSALTPACAQEFDTSRALPKRGTVGEEMYGVLCDRLAAQALREDLTGASFHDVCHKNAKGQWKDQVDQKMLPGIAADAVNERGKRVSADEQRANRDKAVGRVEAFARRRADLIRALDATFPEQKIPIKDIDNPDETKSCDAPRSGGEGVLTQQIADMLGRMTDLYNDGTIPQSTESLAKVVAAFEKSPDAQAAWARISARQGYRPIDTALGTTRPMIAYPQLRDFANASLRLLSADSDPYQRDPKRDEDGNRIPVPGPGNAALVKLLESAHEELLATKVDPALPPLATSVDPLGRVILSRPRDNLEIMQQILFVSDPAFGGGAPRYIVRRDPRGYAAIAGGQVPAPFLDADKDGLPDVDDVGRFKTTNGSLAPSPFPFPGGVDGARDAFGRALAGSQPLYDYIDTSHTFAAQSMVDLKPLVNPDPAAKHETLMDMLGGLTIAAGPRARTSKSYPGGSQVDYDGISAKDSPLLDLIYAMGVILGDKTADQTLALTRELYTTKASQMARVTGALTGAFDIAQKHPEAKIPKTTTFWDENMDLTAEIAKEPGLLEDILRALAAPETQNLGPVIAKDAKLMDQISYDRNDINGAPWNFTTNSKGEMRTPVDRAKPVTGRNRSALTRFLQATADTANVTACSKPDAKVHAIGISLPGTYAECAVFKIENMAIFYLDSIANASQYDANAAVPRGTIYMRPSLLRLVPAGVAGVIEDSSGIKGMWPSAGTVVAPKPEFLNRLVFFDQANDRQNEKTRTFVADLQGPYIGTNVCPERVIDDPDPGAVDAAPDKKIRGLRNCPDGQWLQQRDRDALFSLENFGFYDAIRPLVGAFVKHRREDLFVAMSVSTYKHWPGADASADECRLTGGKACPKNGMMSYEPLLSDVFATDVLPAIGALAKELDTLPIQRCDEIDPKTKACTKSTTVSGIDVVAAAVRASVDPDYAKAQGLKDRRGVVTSKRNDGTTNPQVTPTYLLAQALNGIDQAFDDFEKAHPEDKGERRAGWKRARSQLVDQFMAVKGTGAASTFANATLPKMTPVITDVLRAQLIAHCPQSFTPPYAKCTWAREELAKHAEETVSGPLMASALDTLDAIRSDPEGRKQTELLLNYLLDNASKNDALASMLASSNDLVQIMRDDANLVPLYHVMAEATGASVKDAKGRIVEKSLIDAQMAFLARLNGRYFDEKGVEICKREVDPNQVMAVALANLVTPIKDGDFKGESPLEVIIDVIADVNRVDPTKKYEGTLAKEDYGSVSNNIVDFLVNKERGLEQFYEVIRQGTKF